LNNLTSDEIETRVWAIVVLAITAILFFIVIALLYSVTFVVQPVKAMAPIDQAYTKMLNDIVLLLVGGIGGVVGKKVAGGVASTIGAVKQATAPTMPMMGPGCYGMPGGQMMGQQGYSPMAQQPQAFGAMPTFVNPKFDESWTPPPPPTTPPVLEHDEERERTANARAESKDA
jgi:hypothetical protein